MVKTKNRKGIVESDWNDFDSRYAKMYEEENLKGESMDKDFWLKEWRRKNLIKRLEDDIIDRSSLTKDELAKLDIGDIERKLGIKGQRQK